jgi:hypothetical protein
MDGAVAVRRCSANILTTDRREDPVLRPMPNRYAPLFAAVAIAQLLDLATFVPAVARRGIGAESNPLARALYMWGGPLGPAALKAAAIAIMLVALVRVMRRFPAFVLPYAVLVVTIGPAGTASNVVFGLIH